MRIIEDELLSRGTRLNYSLELIDIIIDVLINNEDLYDTIVRLSID